MRIVASIFQLAFDKPWELITEGNQPRECLRATIYERTRSSLRGGEERRLLSVTIDIDNPIESMRFKCGEVGNVFIAAEEPC